MAVRHRMLSAAVRVFLALSIATSSLLGPVSSVLAARVEDRTEIGSFELESSDLLDSRSNDVVYPPYSEREYVPAYSEANQRGGPNLPPKEGDDPIRFSVEAVPSILAADGLVRLRVTVENNSDQAISNIIFTDRLERGITYVSAYRADVIYNSSANQVEFIFPTFSPGDKVVFSYLLQITDLPGVGQPKGEFWFHISSLRSASTTANLTADVVFWTGNSSFPADSDVRRVSQSGGWIETDTVSIYFPEDSVAEDKVAVIRELASSGSGPEFQFAIDLIDSPSLRLFEGHITASQRIKPGNEFTGPL